jgi:hypothetical protein
MNTIEKLQEILKSRENIGKMLPDIRYFDGCQCFCTPSGKYKAETLEGALSLFLDDNILTFYVLTYYL